LLTASILRHDRRLTYRKWKDKNWGYVWKKKRSN